MQPPSPFTSTPPAEIGLVPVATLVLWLACLAVGLLGIGLSYAHPRPKPPNAEPTQAELLVVELTSDPLPELDSRPPPEPAQPPPLRANVPPPPAPAPLLKLAEPSPAVAFALPVEAPARVVEVAEASVARVVAPVAPAVAPAPAVQPITFGHGEGRQPGPTYPRQALNQGQEGVVAVRMSVGENGRVLVAEASQPSPWPLLNAEAVRVVRERWRFRPGPVRLYEVSIRFEINR